MVSESINNSLFHQLAEQLQQQNLEQFQKQILEHQQHQQKVKETEEKLHSYLLYTFIENEVLLPEQTVVSPCLTFFFVVPSFFLFFSPVHGHGEPGEHLRSGELGPSSTEQRPTAAPRAGNQTG